MTDFMSKSLIQTTHPGDLIRNEAVVYEWVIESLTRLVCFNRF